MKPIQLVVIIAALGMTLGIGFLAGRGSGGDRKQGALTTNAEPQVAYRVPVDGAPSRGRADALVTLVEFANYQDAYAARAHRLVQQLASTYGDGLRVVVRQNPLTTHPRSKLASLAALAAGEQGSFWEMHERLFANQRALDDASLERHAHELGLDVARWKEAVASPRLQEKVREDQQLASALRVAATPPSLFINGKRISGLQSFEAMKQLVEQELAAAREMVEAGTRPEDVYAQILASGVDLTVTEPTSAPPEPEKVVKRIAVPEDAPALGPKAAKVTIVQWSDFECPFCSSAVPTLKRVHEQYPKDVRIVFRHLPLPSHPQARPAAEASLAAHQQGKFWEFHDLLFARQGAFDRDSLERYATQLGLDLPRFRAALDGGALKATVEADIAAATAVGVQGTPTFFVNGRQLQGAYPYEALKPIIDEEIARADALIARGTKVEDLYERLLAEAMTAPTTAAR